MSQLTIETDKDGKGRSFSVELLSYVCARNLWEGGAQEDHNRHRPLWLCFAGSQQEARMFWFNLRDGRSATTGNHKIEILKTGGFKHHVIKLPSGGVVYYVYKADLVAIDPGLVDKDYMRFLALMSTTWYEAQTEEADADYVTLLTTNAKAKGWNRFAIDVSDLRLLQAQANLTRLYIDRRTPYPMPTDSKFSVQLFLRMVYEGMVRTDRSYDHYSRYDTNFSDLKRGNLTSAIVCDTFQSRFNLVLAEEIMLWHALRQSP